MEKLKEQWKDLKQEPQSNIMSMRCNGMSFTAHKMVGNFYILCFVKGRGKLASVAQFNNLME